MRIELEVTQDGHNKLARLRDATGYTDQELFFEALSMLSWAADTIESDRSIGSMDELGKKCVLVDFEFIRRMREK